MSIHKYSTLFLILLFILCKLDLSYSQVDPSLFTPKGISEDVFEKVVLDNKICYRNKKSNEFISQSEYIKFLGLINSDTILDATEHKHTHDHSYDHWECDKVNPYKDVVLPTPFKIKFDQETFTHPVNGEIVVTSRFGRRRRGPHGGLDIDLVTGDSVVSVLPGVVRFVGYSRGHGKTVVVRHANEVETVYAHLSDYRVKANDFISEGELLGLGGNTGNSRGSHLHLEVRYKGIRIHPEYVFNFDGSKTIRNEELWVTNALKSPRFHSSYRKSKLVAISTEEEAIASQKAEPRYHRVRKGDTLSHIARKSHLGVNGLCRLNSISKNATLRIGQLIQIR